MHYRLATPADLPALERLWCDCRPVPGAAAAFAATVAPRVESAVGCVLVAVADGAPGALLTAELVPSSTGDATLQVLDLLVHPAYRYGGVATGLLQETAARARAIGIGALDLSVDPSSPAVELFTALGFRPKCLNMTYRVGAADKVHK